MRLFVVGSADAFNSSGRRHSCYVVENRAGQRLMIDFGGTALAGLRALGLAPNSIGGLVFTHLHGDHVGGFPFLVIDALYQSLRTEPLAIAGPVLTHKLLPDLLDLTYGGVAEDFARLPVPIDEMAVGGVHEVAGFRVEAFAADHMSPPHQPLCLRISDADGTSIAFSGDTRLCPGLFAAADGADLLVAECTRVAPPAGAHITLDEWREALPRVASRRVLLTHLGEDVRARAATFRAETKSPVPFEFAEDGMIIDVEPRP